MTTERKQWVSWEEFNALFPGLSPYSAIDFQRIGGLTPGSIPFADAEGLLDEYNAAFFFDETNVRLGVGVGTPVCTGHFRIAESPDYAGVLPGVALLLENDGNVRIQLQAITTATAYIEFCSDAYNPPAGRIAYDFPNEQLEFGVGGNEILRLKAGPTFDYAGTLTLDGIVAIGGTSLNLRDNAELRFYDNGNYVGFEAPALIANQIWVLPDEDGNANDVLVTSGAGILSWSPAGAGDVTAAANITDHAIVRGNGGVKGIQDSGVIIDDTDNVTGMATLTLPNEGLHILDTGGDHDLIIKPGTNLGADRILTLTTGDAARTITLSGNPTLDDWFDQGVKQADSPTFVNITDAGTEATNMAAGTTGERPGGTVGDIRYNSTLGEFELYVAAWHNLVRSSANVNFGTIGCGTITVADGASINLQEDINFTGATTENLIKFPDNLANALSFMEGTNPYMTFITTDGSEAVVFGKVFTGITGSTIGNLTFADGSITDSGGAISFGDENLSTTGTITVGGHIYRRASDSGVARIYMQNSTTGSTDGDGFYIGIDSDEEGNIWHYEDEDINFATNNTRYMLLTKTGTLQLWNDVQAGLFFYNCSDEFTPTFLGQRSGGSQASKTATQSGWKLFRNSAGGYDGNEWTNARAAIDVYAAENFTATNQGTYMSLLTTPIGSTSMSEAVRIDSTGYVGINVTPLQPLHVISTTPFALAADTYCDTLFLRDTSTGVGDGHVGASLAFASQRATMRQAAIASYQDGTDRDCAGLQFYTKSTTGSTGDIGLRVTIDKDGNVGVGQATFGTNMTKGFALGTGVAPTSSPVDCFQMYSADQAEGNACPHFRTENNAIIKLYQQAHIVDADGQLADITTKFNTLLSYLENTGLLANA